MKTKQTESGLWLAESDPAPESDQESGPQAGWPVKQGWVCDKTGERYFKSDDVEFRKEALEMLYIAIDPGGGGVPLNEEVRKKTEDRRGRRKACIDELAFELVGGVPEMGEQYT